MQAPRATRIDTYPDYNETKRNITRAAAAHQHVWVEAETLLPNTTVWPPRTNAVAYTVHASAFAADVPAFAIETYESGKLVDYEPSQQRILELAAMPEADRRAAIQAQRARIDVAMNERSHEHLARAGRVSMAA